MSTMMLLSGIISSTMAGLLFRVTLMLYGLWQDSVMVVKYTDVDYWVFTDAARFVTEGESPYNRATYRYTPILAWLLTPNIYLGVLFGKTLFIICDVAVGYLIYRILKLQSYTEKSAVFCSQLWLLNPLPATVSSRGNAESIIALLVVATLYCLLNEGIRFQTAAAVLYSAAMHMKIYPVTYCLAIYLFLHHGHKFKLTSWDVLTYSAPNKTRLLFVLCGGCTFALLTGGCYRMYGEEFLQETYFYHITRRDTRHNFSPYFYLLYLTAESGQSHWLGLGTFLPQAALLLVVSIKYHGDLPFCCFLQTFIFVTFNKVCTSQYFLWYMSLLPLVVPHLIMSFSSAAVVIASWFLGQALWLLPAYYLEFEGWQTFIHIWVAGLLFFIINIGILAKILTSYRPRPMEQVQFLTVGELVGKFVSNILRKRKEKGS